MPIFKPRHVVPDFRGNYPIGHRGHSNFGPNGAFEEEHAEMPWVGIASTVPDMFRFAEMFRQDGALDGARILSPATLALARRNWTGEKPNELYAARGRERGWDPAPAYIGLGFFVARHGDVPPHLRHAGFARAPSATTAQAPRCSGSIRSANCRSPFSRRV